MSQQHGMFGSLKAVDVEIPITEWSGDHKNDAKEGTTTSNNGFRSWVAGLESMSGSYKAIWDTGENPYILNVKPGTFVNIELHVSPTAYYGFQTIILNVSISSPVQDLITYSCNYESNGTITPPGA